jgi:asparagine synthase (glutamine-hydrolysing)
VPGLAGIVSKHLLPESKGTLDAMIKCMMHRPFYRSGVSADQQLGLQCGWVSEAGSFADCLPVWNERRDICLFFSGEEFAEQSELDRLRGRGHEFDGRNASYLVHWYEEEGVKFLEKLNGGFSGVILDLREGKVVLFNDRFGLGRMHVHENEDGFYFSSEAKSLLKVLPELRQLDPRSLGEYFSIACILQNRTMFSGIALLPPGSAWTFRPGQPAEKRLYFRVEQWEQQPVLGEAEYYGRLKETWPRILSRYLRGPQRVALSLTGGVDSRLILAWARCPTGALPCYTFGGPYRECADVKISREVARICGQPHQTIPVDGVFISEYPRLAEQTVYLSDGTVELTAAIDLYIQQKARAIAPARVTGTNGGEILRSLVAFKPMRLRADLFAGELRHSIGVASETYAGELTGRRLSFTAFKQAPWFMCSKFIVERSEVMLRMPYFDNDLVSLVYQAPPTLRDDNALSLRLIAEGCPGLRQVRTDRGIALGRAPGVGRARHLMEEFTFKAEYAYDYGMPQWLAKADHAFAPLHLERLFLGRHKFYHFRVWFRDQLAPYLKEVLLSQRARTRSYINGEFLDKMIRDHCDGRANYTLEIHRVLAVELLQRKLIDPE